MNNDDMKITSKFNEGDTIWFFEPGQVKFMEGVISSVNSWDKWGGFHYEIQHIDTTGVQMVYTSDEKNMFSSKNEIIANVFEENGTLAPVEEPTPAPEAA